ARRGTGAAGWGVQTQAATASRANGMRRATALILLTKPLRTSAASRLKVSCMRLLPTSRAMTWASPGLPARSPGLPSLAAAHMVLPTTPGREDGGRTYRASAAHAQRQPALGRSLPARPD